MKKISLVVGSILISLTCYVLSIYSFTLNENIVGRIEIRKFGGERVALSQEETSNLVKEFNHLKFRVLHDDDIEFRTDELGYTGVGEEFRIFVFDKNENQLADIKVYDDTNISYVKEFDGSLSLGYHATNGEFDLEQLNSLVE